MARFMNMAALTIGLAMLGACTEGVQTGSPAAQPAGPASRLTVMNNTGQTLTSIRLSTCETGNFGSNRLPHGFKLYQNNGYTWAVAAGCWDILGSNGRSEVQSRITLVAGRPAEVTIQR